MKPFNTNDPIIETPHYFTPDPLNPAVLDQYIENQFYFLLYGSKKSDKTKRIKNYVKYVNQAGKYFAFYVNANLDWKDAGPMQAKGQYERVVYWINTQITHQVQHLLPDIHPALQKFAEYPIEEIFFSDLLIELSEMSPKPIVLFLDEFDALDTDSIVFLIKNIRPRFEYRPNHFPQSICFMVDEKFPHSRIRISDILGYFVTFRLDKNPFPYY